MIGNSRAMAAKATPKPSRVRQKSLFAFEGFEKRINVNGTPVKVVPSGDEEFLSEHPLLCKWDGCGQRFSRGSARASHERTCKFKKNNEHLLRPGSLELRFGTARRDDPHFPRGAEVRWLGGPALERELSFCVDMPPLLRRPGRAAAATCTRLQRRGWDCRP